MIRESITDQWEPYVHPLWSIGEPKNDNNSCKLMTRDMLRSPLTTAIFIRGSTREAHNGGDVHVWLTSLPMARICLIDCLWMHSQALWQC